MVENAGEQVFVPGEGCSEEVMASAGMCIASADLLFSESTVEQVAISYVACSVVLTGTQRTGM